jgi:hypothetical protein
LRHCLFAESDLVHHDLRRKKFVLLALQIPPVQTVLEFLAAGDSVAEVLEEYPSLKREDVQSCLDYASKLMANHYSVVPMT